MESLHDKDALEDGESQLWPIIDPDDEQDTDHKPGLHIIEKVEFASAEWTSEANNGLRKDMENKQILFPRFDGFTLSLASERDIENEKVNYNTDSLEGCIMEIEELKNELSTIVMTQTGVAGRDRWDTPEIKTETGKKGRLRKDRYSALLIANMLARSINRADAPFKIGQIGGLRQDLAAKKVEGQLYYGNEWYRVDANTFKGVKRK